MAYIVLISKNIPWQLINVKELHAILPFYRHNVSFFDLFTRKILIWVLDLEVFILYIMIMNLAISK